MVVGIHSPSHLLVDTSNQTPGIVEVSHIALTEHKAAVERPELSGSHIPGYKVALLAQIGGHLQGNPVGKLAGIGQGKGIVQEVGTISDFEAIGIADQLLDEKGPQALLVVHTIIARLIDIQFDPLYSAGYENGNGFHIVVVDQTALCTVICDIGDGNTPPIAVFTVRGSLIITGGI